jgi:hypothetical protein
MENPLSYFEWLLEQKFEAKGKSILLGVRASKSQKIVGVIGGGPIQLNIRDSIVDTFDCKILCVHKKYRTKRLSCLMMKQLIHGAGPHYKYGHFFSEEFVAKPVCTTTWWRADINKKFKKPIVVGKVRAMEDSDTISVLLMLKDHLKQYQIK